MNYKNILHVDDDSDDCELFMEALQEVSDAMYTAIYNPVEALKKLIDKEVKPDVIFLDLNMPFMTGLEFLTAIKKKETIKDIPVIIFSTSQFSNIIKEAKEHGAYDFISKPNSFEDLKELLSKYYLNA